jgi:electron transfer flavoprotein beta subunit
MAKAPAGAVPHFATATKGVTVDIVVCVKTNPDLQMVRVKNREAVLEAVPYKVGDLEKNALEAAILLRDDAGGKITALCVAESNRKAKETIKEALAMGADEAVIVDDPALAEADQTAVAATLAAAVKKLGACDLLLFGEGSTDNYTGQVGPRVAELLGLPQIGYVRTIEAADGGVRCERSMDDMLETLAAPLPVVVTVVSEINEPRIPGLMNIMKAKSKPLQEWALADLALDAGALAPQREIVSNLAEEQDRKHILFDGSAAEQADAFVNALIKEGVLGR